MQNLNLYLLFGEGFIFKMYIKYVLGLWYKSFEKNKI